MNRRNKTSGEYDRFADALGKVLRVSHTDLKRAMSEEKKAKAERVKPVSSASRASDEKN